VNINDGFRFELAYYDGELSAGYSSDEQYWMEIEHKVIDEANEVHAYTIGILDVRDKKNAVRLDTQFMFKQDGNLAFLSVQNEKTNQPISSARSPDSKWEVFSSDKDGNWEIYVREVEDNNKVYRLASNDYLDIEPVWRPQSAASKDS
jgi:Tol biopolymer transport system component